MGYESYETLRIECELGIATVTLNRPEKLNAIDGAMHAELERVWRDLDEDTEVRAVVLTGAGRAFSAGGDAQAIQAGAYHPFRKEVFRHARRLVLDLLELEVPLICAVNGDAVGLAANLALYCDVIYMERSARIGDPHVKMGAAAGDGAAVIWPLLCGPARAKQYLMTGDLLSAEKAYEIGLVNEVVDDGTSVEKARAFGARLLTLPPLAVRWTKHSINQTVRAHLLHTFDLAMALESVTLLGEDHQEAVSAFIEKREPKFEGR
jgi:enoyl-CoA hydratase